MVEIKIEPQKVQQISKGSTYRVKHALNMLFNFFLAI